MSVLKFHLITSAEKSVVFSLTITPWADTFIALLNFSRLLERNAQTFGSHTWGTGFCFLPEKSKIKNKDFRNLTTFFKFSPRVPKAFLSLG